MTLRRLTMFSFSSFRGRGPPWSPLGDLSPLAAASEDASGPDRTPARGSRGQTGVGPLDRILDGAEEPLTDGKHGEVVDRQSVGAGP